MEKTKHFKPKAHILRLLGEELIKSPIMAIYELVKNSYDADSNIVNVDFEQIEDKESACIKIEDNGTGLTKDVIENVWLEPGTDHRKPIDEIGNRIINRSPLFDRVPMGEKGVGRFAVHKLGNVINLITRPSEIIEDELGKKIKQLYDYEISLTVDWNAFSQSKYLEDIPISWQIESNKSKFHFKDDSGTLIKIKSLKEVWTRRMARGLKRNIVSMLSPKNNSNSFLINLNFGNHWLDNFPDAAEILKIAPYNFTCILDEDYNLNYEYSCEFQLNNKFGKRVIDSREVNIKGALIKALKSKLEKEDILTKEELKEQLLIFKPKIPFGNLLLETYAFDLDSTTLKNYTYDSKTLKSVLKFHSGIKVFKDEMRVFNYGEPGNDWLELENKRINNKSWISNNLNIGFVYLDSAKSNSLIEKTNREGFVESNDYKLFEHCILGILNEFRIERWKDRQKWLDFIAPPPNPKSLNQANLFNQIIDSTDFSDDEKKEKLKKEAENLQKDYEKKNETLLIPAGVGMTASVALHEIEKLVPRIKETVNENPFNYSIGNEQVDELKDYVQGILSVLRKGGNKPIDLKQSIEKSISNYSFKLRKRNIIIDTIFDEDLDTIKCDKRYFITMIMNILDNSMYWLDTIYKEDKGIFVKTSVEDNSPIIIIVDNGPGFKDNIEDIVRPFFSRKDDGIGIGLYLIDTIMMKYGKFEIIEVDEMEDYEIPNEYRGAGVKLVFSKNQ